MNGTSTTARKPRRFRLTTALALAVATLVAAAAPAAADDFVELGGDGF